MLLLLGCLVYTGSHFQRKIRDGKTLKNFVGGAGDMFIIPEVESVRRVSTKAKPVVLCHLIERGLFSRQCYMAAGGNHRELQMKHWVSLDEKKPCTMIDSLLYYYGNDQSCRFDIDSHIGMCFHGVEACSNTTSDESVRLRSQCKLVSQSGGRIASGFSFAKDRCFSNMSGEHFTRLLRFFGLQWWDQEANAVKSIESEVTFEDISTFVALFCNVDLLSEEGFKSFYEKFEFSDVFTYDETDDIFVLNAYFGELLRSLVPVRLQVYDGQHRMLLMALFSTGCFNPTTQVPLEVTAWEESMYRDFKIADSQLNQVLTYDVGIAYQKNGDRTSNPRVVLKQLMLAGDTITNGASNCIEPTYEEMFQKVNAILDEKRNVVAYSHATFWRVDDPQSDPVKAITNVENNGKAYFECFDEVIKSHGRFRKLLLSEDKAEANDWSSASASLKKWLPSISGTSLIPNGSKEIQVKTAEVLAVWRATADRRATRDKLTSMMEYVSTTHPQVCGVTKVQTNLAHFTTVSWLRKYIYGPASVVTNHFMCRYFIEQFIINTLRNTKEVGSNGPLRTGIRNGFKFSPEDFKQWPHAAAFRSANLNDIKGCLPKYGKAGDMNDRIQFAIFASVVNEIIRTVKVYGYDPDFYDRPVSKKNKNDGNKENLRQFKLAWNEAKLLVSQEMQKAGYKPAARAGSHPQGTPPYLFEEGMYFDLPKASDEEDGEDENEDDTKDKKGKKKPRQYNIYFDVVAKMKELAQKNGNLTLVSTHLNNNIAREYMQ